MVDVRPLVEEARGIHLLVDLYEQQAWYTQSLVGA